MAFDKQIRLLERLVYKTRISEIEWKRTAEDGVFQVILRKNTVKLRMTPPSGTSEMYTIELVDSTGEVADSFNDADLDNEVYGQADQEYYRMMKGLYETSRRQAFGSDKVLNEILRDLE